MSQYGRHLAHGAEPGEMQQLRLKLRQVLLGPLALRNVPDQAGYDDFSRLRVPVCVRAFLEPSHFAVPRADDAELTMPAPAVPCGGFDRRLISLPVGRMDEAEA